MSKSGSRNVEYVRHVKYVKVCKQIVAMIQETEWRGGFRGANLVRARPGRVTCWRFRGVRVGL